MEMLNKGSIKKILRGEELNPPIILLVEEACQLYVDSDGGAESGVASVRLRLSDSIDSFSGFVCKTKIAHELIPGSVVCIEAFNVESLGVNKIVCKINSMSIIHDDKDGNVIRTNFLRCVSNTDEMSPCDMQENLVSIHLADVDLSTGKKNIIRARVTAKSAVKTYDLNQHKLFYFDIMDDSETLRVKAFDRQCDRIFPCVCIGEMIELSKFYVTIANKKYSQLKSDYDIVVQEYTEFVVVRNVAPISIMPTFQFNLLREIELLKVDGLYDTIGIIKSVGPSTVVHERVSSKPLLIVRLLLFDSSGNMEINLWNDMASSFIGQKNDILAVKGFRLNVYHKKYSLNSVMGSDIFLNPTCEETNKLRSLIVSRVFDNDETKD